MSRVWNNYLEWDYTQIWESKKQKLLEDTKGNNFNCAKFMKTVWWKIVESIKCFKQDYQIFEFT